MNDILVALVAKGFEYELSKYAKGVFATTLLHGGDFWKGYGTSPQQSLDNALTKVPRSLWGS